jgi:hypothetical protein
LAVAYRSSSLTGTSDSFIASINVPVPTGAAAGDIALVAIGRWESSNPAITAPSGFTQITQVVSGNNKLAVFWKRLTGADSGSYTFTWSGQQWSLGQAMLITGALASGDPVDASSGLAASGTTYPGTSVTATDADFLALFAYHETSGAGTPPSGFTEVQDANNLKSNYRVLTASGTYSGSGGTMPSGVVCGVLVALKPAGGGAGSQTISPQLVASTATVGQLTVVPGAVTVAPQLLTSGATVGQPAVAPGPATVAPQIVDSGATVGQPAITVGAVAVSPELLASTATVGEPTLAPGAVTASPDRVESTAVVGEPTVLTTGSIEPERVASSATVGQPTVTPGAVTIAPELVASTATVDEPSITSGVLVEPQLVAATATIGQPTVTPGAISRTLQRVESTASVGQPAVVPGPVGVAPQLVASTATVGQPMVVLIDVIRPELVASTATVGEPALAAGPVTVEPGLVASTAVVGQPFVSGGVQPPESGSMRPVAAPGPTAVPATARRALAMSGRTGTGPTMRGT